MKSCIPLLFSYLVSVRIKGSIWFNFYVVLCHTFGISFFLLFFFFSFEKLSLWKALRFSPECLWECTTWPHNFRTLPEIAKAKIVAYLEFAYVNFSRIHKCKIRPFFNILPELLQNVLICCCCGRNYESKSKSINQGAFHKLRQQNNG